MPFTTARRRGLVVALLAGALALVGAAGPTIARAPFPDRIDLPDGFQPEGIESSGHWLFAGSLAGGAIWRADAVTGEGEELVAPAGTVAVGLHVDDRGRLWVAGGPTATIRVYSTRTGELLQTYAFPGAGFLNDLDIVDGVVYATDSLNPQLAVVPLGPGGSLPGPSAATTMPVDIDYVAGFNANGIVAEPGGWLLVVQTNTGLLFRVDPATGDAVAVDTGGYSLAFGDGMELRGRTLYVVRNQLATVAVLRLAADLSSASLVGEITAAPGALSVPTTATVAVGSLWVVNARFGVPPTAQTEYWISRLPLMP